MPSRAVTDLMRALVYVRRERRRCERRLEALRAELAVPKAAEPHDGGARGERSTSGWTEEKRLAVSRRMRDYWASRRSTGPEGRERSPSPLVTARDREPMSEERGARS